MISNCGPDFMKKNATKVDFVLQPSLQYELYFRNIHIRFPKFAVKIPEVTKTVRKMVKKSNEAIDILHLSSCNHIDKLNKSFSKAHHDAKDHTVGTLTKQTSGLDQSVISYLTFGLKIRA